MSGETPLPIIRRFGSMRMSVQSAQAAWHTVQSVGWKSIAKPGHRSVLLCVFLAAVPFRFISKKNIMVVGELGGNAVPVVAVPYSGKAYSLVRK